MAEFKIAPALASEISAFQQAGKEPDITLPTVTNNTQTLAVCQRFAEEHAKIKALLISYCNLVQKDAKDLENMMETAQEMDTTLAGSY